MSCSMEISARPCAVANSRSSGSLAMVPSSLTTSASTPASGSPASLARSTAASVCPGLRSTPPSAYRSGNTCPGRTRSAAVVAGSARRLIVVARSAAEMPVVTPSRASTLRVKAVRMRSVFCELISGSCSRSSSAPRSGAQITPLVYRIMKASSSGVARLAAMMMSPSFSLFASSTTTTGRPAAMSLIARSTSSNIPGLPAHQPLHVLGDHVGLQVNRIAWPGGAEGGPPQRLRDQADLEPALRLAQRGHGQADPVDGDRPLFHDITGDGARHADPDPVPVPGGAPRQHGAGAVHVALHEVAAEPVGEADRALQVDRRARGERAERRPGQRLLGDVRGERSRGAAEDAGHGQAHAADRDRLPG